MLNRSIGLLISELESGGGSMELGGTTMEKTVGQGAADALVKEDEYEGDPGAFVGQPVGVAMAVSFQ